MEIPIDIGEVTAANHFLRALWAEFRRECGKCAWQYTPWRDGERQRVTFGFMDIGRPEAALEVGVSYRQRGSIRAIEFRYAHGSGAVEPDSELGQLIRRVVDSARVRVGAPETKTYSTTVECLTRPPGVYTGSVFQMVPVAGREFQLSITVRAYDEPDAHTVLRGKLPVVLDTLSVETNSAFWPATGDDIPENDPLADGVPTAESFAPDPGWIDEYPVLGGCYQISREAKELIDRVLNADEQPADVATMLRAFGHFHTARKYAAQITDILALGPATENENGGHSVPVLVRDRRLETAGRMGAAHAEITGSLYMSALEVAAKIGCPDPSGCSACGQPQYKISQRVVDLMTRCGGPHLGRIGKDYYGRRSKYLHEGLMLASSDYAGVSIPQLDPASPTGCRSQVVTPCPNLKEYAGLCLRRVLKDAMNSPT